MRLIVCSLAVTVVVVAGTTSATQEKATERFGSRTITHVGMLARDAEKMASAYADAFGVAVSPVAEPPRSAFPAGYKGDMNARTRVVNVQFENMTPRDRRADRWAQPLAGILGDQGRGSSSHCVRR